MKSKCSFILKALTAMVLAVILLFSTVATGVAAIVEDIADTGAQVDTADSGAIADIADTGISGGTRVYLYVRVTDVSWWTGSSVTHLYLFNSTSNTWVTSSTQSGDYFQFLVPSGTWTGAIAVRKDSSKTNGANWNNVWNQTNDVTLDNSHNCIRISDSKTNNKNDFTQEAYNKYTSTGSISSSNSGTTTMGTAVTLTASLGSNTNYNVANGLVGASVTLNGTATSASTDFALAGTSFTPKQAGIFGISSKVYYYPNGFSGISFQTASTSVNVKSNFKAGNAYKIVNNVAGAWENNISQAQVMSKNGDNQFYYDFYLKKNDVNSTDYLLYRLYDTQNSKRIAPAYAGDHRHNLTAHGSANGDSVIKDITNYDDKETCWRAYLNIATFANTTSLYRVRVYFDPAATSTYSGTTYTSGKTWYEVSALTAMSPTLSSTSFTAGTTYSLATISALAQITTNSGVSGDASVTFGTFKVADNSSMTSATTLSNVTSWTPATSGTYYIQFVATDGGLVTTNAAGTSYTQNTKSTYSRTETAKIAVTVSEVKKTVNVSAGDHGSVDETELTVGKETSDTVTATPDSGYAFSGWTYDAEKISVADVDNGDGTHTATVLSLDYSTTAEDLTANFIQEAVPVTTDVYSTYADGSSSAYAANNSACSVTISPDLDGSGNATAGTTYTFTANADAGYEFVDFVNASNVAYTTSGNITVNGNTLTVTGINAAMHVRARFKRGTYVQFVDYDSDELKAATWVDYNADAVPPSDPSREGYTFDGWSPAYAGVTSTTNPYVVMAQYTQITYDITVSAIGMDNSTTGYAVALANAPTTTNNGGVLNGVPYGTAMTFTQAANSGYKFVGWVVTSDDAAAVSTFAADQTVTSGNTKTFTVNSATDGNYHVYALYKKVYYLTFYNTTENIGTDESPVWKYISAPPRTVVVTRGSETITYTYKMGDLEARGEDNKYYQSITTPDPGFEEHIVSATGYYYEGNKLEVLAGDQVVATYSYLTSSDTISGVFFDNARRYTTELEPDDLYTARAWSGYDYDGENHDNDEGRGTDDKTAAYTYLPAQTLYADPNYYDTTDPEAPEHNIIGSTYVATLNNNTHAVSWTINQDYYNIDLELATKRRVYFSDTKNTVITSKNDENYYNVNEALGPGFTVAAKASATQTNKIDGTAVTFWRANSDGTKGAALDPEVVSALGLTIAAGPSTSGSSTNGTALAITGTMPNYDIYIDLGLTVTFNCKIGSWMLSDPINGGTAGFNKWNKVASVTGTATFVSGTSQSDTTYNVADNARATVDSKTIVKGGKITYSTGLYNDYKNNYLFIGWYKGTASAPDLENGLLSKDASYTYEPKEHLHVWAVGTRAMYIGGSFYINNGVQTYVADNNANATWATNRQMMTFDTANSRYMYTFDTVSKDSGYHFRVYEKASSANGESDATIWNRWASNGGTKYNHDYNGTTYTLNYGRYYTSNQDTNAGGWDNCGWFTVNDTVINGGYNAPVTVYFYPATGGIEVSATYQWKMLYVSSGANGYENGTSITNNTSNTGSAPNKTVTVAGQSGAVVTTSGSAWNPTGSYTSELNVTGYYVKTKDGVVRVTKTVTAAVSVEAFVVYEYDNKNKDTGRYNVYSVKAKSDTANVYYADITVSENMYVCPVMKKSSADMLVYVNYEDLDTSKWGSLISLYAWNTSDAALNGAYPGQLMIPSNDGKTWYANIDSTNLAGISFANYYTGTWVQNQLTNVKTVIAKYNTIGGGNNRNVQTYDYREPVSLKAKYVGGEGDSLILSFTLKDGNTDLTSYNGSSDSNGVVNSSFYTAYYNQTINPNSGSLHFEYLTDRTGDHYTDLTGKVIDGQPTASFYVICKGNTYYNAGRNNNKAAIDYSAYATFTGKWAVEWYVYDNSGNFITAILSDAYANETTYMGRKLSIIAQKVEEAGYPYEDRAVAISYDYPMHYSSNTTYRYSGQWYTTTASTPVKVNVEVALKTGEDADGDIIVPADSYTAGYGTASVRYTGSTTNTIGSNNEWIEIKLSDAINKPVEISATETNFIGWYTYDKDSEKFLPVPDSSRTFNPDFNGPITYYALYEAKAMYVFTYTGRDGSTKNYTVLAPSRLTDAEIADDNIPRHDTDIDGAGTTRLMEAASLLPTITQLAVFETTVTFSTTNYTESKYTITFDCTASSTPNTYTLTYHYYDGSGASSATSASITRAYGKAISLSYDKYIKVANNGPSGKVFKGWYDASSGGNLISTYPSFGMAIVQDTEVWAQYDTTVGAYPDSQTPEIEKNVLSLERLSATAGTFYNDFIVRYYDGENAITPSKCGILIIYQNDTASAIGSLTTANLGTITTQLRANPGKTANLTTKNAKAYNITCESLSIFNRIDLVFKTSMATTGNRAYNAYAYFIDSSGNYHFTAATSGNYNTFI